MIQINLPSMSCGHCVKAVTQAVQDVDPRAKVDVDLGSKDVRIDSQADAAKILESLKEAGYEPA